MLVYNSTNKDKWKTHLTCIIEYKKEYDILRWKFAHKYGEELS